MKHYVIYDPTTGDILSCVQAPEEQFPKEGPLADGSGLAVRYGKAEPDAMRVLGGRIISKTNAAIQNHGVQQIRQSFIAERHRLLASSDWTQVPDVPMTEGLRQRWRDYRQALRDLPSLLDWAAITSFSDIPWPLQPEKKEPTNGVE